MPKTFVAAMRQCHKINDLKKAKQTAVELFSDLPGFSADDVRKVKEAVKMAWKK